MNGVDVALARAAAGSLLDQPTHRPVGVSCARAAALLAAADQHRISGLLAQAVDDRFLLTDEAFRAAAHEQHLAALRTSVRCEMVAASVTAALSASGIESRALKGVAMAHLDYGDPSRRVFGDADLLVRRRGLLDALAVLEALGFTRDHPPVRGWWERRFGKAVVLSDRHGVEIDLHLTIAGGYYGLRIPTDELFVPGDEFEVAGVSMTALPRHLRLVQAALHAVLGGGSGLRALRDVAQLAVDRPTLEAARTAAQRWQCEPVVATAIRAAWTVLSLPTHHDAILWANQIPISTTDDQRMSASAGDAAAGWAGEGRAAVAALPRWRRPAYLVGLAFPSRASLRARQRSLPRHLVRIASRSRG